jgi:hypothetical protein
MISILAAVLLGVVQADTLRLQVGSAEVNGAVYPEHRARNRVYRGDRGAPPVSEWTNDLTLGDSAGRRVMRWVTRGGQGASGWELLQTYDARTLAPYTYSRRSGSGAFVDLTFDGARVRGSRKVSATAEVEQIDRTLSSAAFPAHASDLVPLAVGLREGAVMTLPVWSPGMPDAVTHVFSVRGRQAVEVEGGSIEAWKVDEHRQSDGALVATWYLIDRSPYMVYAEVPLPNGTVQRITGVDLP